MLKPVFIIILFLLPVQRIVSQPSFEDLVAISFGSDQELVNGIQFANQYSLVDGHPYFLDEQFRTGSLHTNTQVYEQQRIRYNLYSQRLEVEYRSAEGFLNQFISVPENIPAFSLGKRHFIRLQPGEEPPAYYQVISSGSISCFIGWRKVMRLSRSDSSREYQFSSLQRTYWLRLYQDLLPFHNRKTFLGHFPDQMQKDIGKLLKQHKFSFRQASVSQVEAMVAAAFQIYQGGVSP